MKRGLLIAVEGIDFSGKTRMIDNIKKTIPDSKNRYFSASDDSDTGKSIGKLLETKKSISGSSLSILFSQSRQKLIATALYYLNSGINVWFDRYILSSIVYQHYGQGVPIEFILNLHKHDCYGLFPDLTIYIRSSLFEFKNTKQHLDSLNLNTDSMENQSDEFMRRVISGYEQEILQKRFTGETMICCGADDAIFKCERLIQLNIDQFGIN